MPRGRSRNVSVIWSRRKFNEQLVRAQKHDDVYIHDLAMALRKIGELETTAGDFAKSFKTLTKAMETH